MRTEYWLVYHMIGGTSFESIDRFDEIELEEVKEEQVTGVYKGEPITVNTTSGQVFILTTNLAAIEIRSHSYDDDF